MSYCRTLFFLRQENPEGIEEGNNEKKKRKKKNNHEAHA